MTLALHIQDASGEVLHPVRVGEQLTVGRAQHCTIRIQEKVVSAQHLLLIVHDDHLEVLDESRNGTLVAGQLLKGQRTAAQFGSPIELGTTTLRLLRSPSTHQLPRAEEPSRKLPIAQRTLTGAEPSGPRAIPATEGKDVGARSEFEIPSNSASAELRREAHRRLLQYLDLSNGDVGALPAETLRPKVLQALRLILKELADPSHQTLDFNTLVGELADEALGLGPLETLLADPTVSEIMVVDPQTIFVERHGVCQRVQLRFTDDIRLRAVVERIATPLGRRIDESSPLLDARLPDGSRVNAVIRPLALRGTCLTIRKFPKKRLDFAALERLGTLTPKMSQFLRCAVIAKKNIVVAGGTGSGKTTLLNVLSTAIPERERIITIEDSAELQLSQPHVVALETKAVNLEGKGEYNIRALVRNALRMRPDRIVVGECRGGEALDMLQAMNTGHEGSLTTLHANTPRETLARLETLCLMAGLDLPVRVIREQIASSLHLLIQQQRLPDGARKITSITEVIGLDTQARIRTRELFSFARTAPSDIDTIGGEFQASGFLPSFMHELAAQGLQDPGDFR